MIHINCPKPYRTTSILNPDKSIGAVNTSCCKAKRQQ